MEGTRDPLSQLYDKLWDMLESHRGFTDLIKVGNRLKFAGDCRDPAKINAATADKPWVGILPTDTEPHMISDSSGNTLTAHFDVLIVTGERRVDTQQSIYPVIWETWAAMAEWNSQITQLTWNDENYVKHGFPVGLQIQLGGEHDRGIPGWFASWRYLVLMYFSTVNLKAEE